MGVTQIEKKLKEWMKPAAKPGSENTNKHVSLLHYFDSVGASAGYISIE